MHPLIPTIPLNDKHVIPAIGFGTGSALFGKDATASVVQAIEGGFTHIDTAQVYQNEQFVGDALRQVLEKPATTPHGDDQLDLEKQSARNLRRKDIWVTTKYPGSGSNAEDALDVSLEKLGLSSVNLYLIHFPRGPTNIIRAWSEFESAHAHGKAKSIGVSNFTVDDLKLVIEHGKLVPAVNQIRFHPYNYHEHIELLDYAKKHNIVIESYSGLTPITKLPGGRLDGVLAKIAARLGPKVTPGQVIENWIRAKGVVIVTTTSRKERIQEYLSVFDLPKLTQDEIAAIDEAGNYPPTVINSELFLRERTTSERRVQRIGVLTVITLGLLLVCYGLSGFCKRYLIT